MLVAAGLGPPLEHALISLLAVNGLRVSEATGADIEHLGLERGHRTLTITRRAARSSPSRWRLAPPGRSTWPPVNDPAGLSSSPPTGGGWTAMVPDASSGGSPARPGSPRKSALTRCGTRSSPRRWMPGCRCATRKRPPRTLTRAPRCGTTGPAAAWIGTLRTLSPRSSLVPPGSPHRLAALPGRLRPQPPGGQNHCRSPARPRGGNGPQPHGEREPPLGTRTGYSAWIHRLFPVMLSGSDFSTRSFHR